MRSARRGENTSEVELTAVSARGIRLRVDGHDLDLPYDDFPWFRDATIRELATIERPAPDHLRWPDLDVDLSLDSIEHPERYPLVSRRESR